MPSSLLDEHFGAYLGCSSTHKEAQALTSRSSKKSQKRKKPSRPSTVKTSSGDDDMGDEERKRAKRRSQNRVSAQISREKKRLYVESLEKRVRALEKKNAQLNKTITMLLNNQNVTAPMTPPEDSEYMTAAGNTSSDYTPSPPPSPPMEPAAVPPPPPVLDPPLELRNLQEISIDEPAVGGANLGFFPNASSPSGSYHAVCNGAVGYGAVLPNASFPGVSSTLLPPPPPDVLSPNHDGFKVENFEMDFNFQPPESPYSFNPSGELLFGRADSPSVSVKTEPIW